MTMKAGVETGSLMNHIMCYDGTAPEVGMGCTILCWTDRRPGTIIKVTRTQVHVRECLATRTDSNGLSEMQTYEFAEDPNARVDIFRMTKRGWRNSCGNGLLVGHREKYHDSTF